MTLRRYSPWLLMLLLFGACADKEPNQPGPAGAAGYSSIQAALDSNKGKLLYLPEGVHGISKALLIEADGSGLYGPGTISQADPDQDILVSRDAADVRIEGITLTRSEVQLGKNAVAVRAENCRSLLLRDLHVRNNRSDVAAIFIRQSDHARVEDRGIADYKTIHVDDRLESPCIDTPSTPWTATA
ncbi:MAG: hypothetical protein HXY20_05310 [Acidobacteria bacterium]|nr:hypothetical protein [Acidobacteriota bacterium]